MKLVKDTGGATYVEFLIAFIPVFFLFLGILQAGLLYTANLVVTHSANSATRAAIVVLPDDPRAYGDEPVNQIGGSGGGGTDAVASFLGGFGLGGGGGPVMGGGRGGRRLSAIRAAASLPLLAVSPSFRQLVGDPSVYQAIGGHPGERAATGAALYNRAAMAVSFPSAPASRSFRSSWDPNSDVTVRVTYLFHCGIPLVARLMCDDYFSLRTGVPTAAVADLTRAAARGADAQEMASHIRRVRIAEGRVARGQQGIRELDYAELPWVASLTALTGSRFVVLQAEATLRNHGAPYTYRGDAPSGSAL
jgi:hypothetical protein